MSVFHVILVQSFSARPYSRNFCTCYTANAVLFPVQRFISLVIYSWWDWQTRNQNKTVAFAVIKRHLQLQKREFADEPLSANETFLVPLKFSQELCADWLVCIAYCIFWHLIGSDNLKRFLPTYRKLSKLILNRPFFPIGRPYWIN